MAGGHGIVAADDLKIIATNFYNGFQTALNVATNVLTVNGTFVSTNTGSIERNLSLDETDKRVSGTRNPGLSDSKSIACAHVNDNSTANGAIVNNTFTDMVFGTVGAALLASSTMQRWKLVDELNGTFEFIDNFPFTGLITFDFTVVAGGEADFRFKWLVDTGSGFVNLTDDVEVLAGLKDTATSVTKTFPLGVSTGDRIKPQITRNATSVAVTTTYATIYVTD